MDQFFVSVGSNIDPRQNIARTLAALLRLSPTLHVSRIVTTQPVGVTGGDFLNLVVGLTSPDPARQLKEQFNRIEAELGRDRADPARSQKSRPIDLDILFSLPPEAASVDAQFLPPEAYIRPMLLELLDFLGIRHGQPADLLPDGVEIPLPGVTVGRQPLTLSQNPDAGRVEIVR